MEGSFLVIIEWSKHNLTKLKYTSYSYTAQKGTPKKKTNPEASTERY
jgi:hypothetical protein